jgi:hypothetical protein
MPHSFVTTWGLAQDFHFTLGTVEDPLLLRGDNPFAVASGLRGYTI